MARSGLPRVTHESQLLQNQTKATVFSLLVHQCEQINVRHYATESRG